MSDLMISQTRTPIVSARQRFVPFAVALLLAGAHGVAQQAPAPAPAEPPIPQAQGEVQPIQVPVPSDTAPALPQRVGIDSAQPVSLDEAIRQVLENNRAIAVSRSDVERSRLGVDVARGALDSVFGWQTYYLRQVTPVSSVLGGSTTGSLTQKTFATAPEFTGFISGTGATYQAQLSLQRSTSNSEFQSLNPQYPSSLNLSITQPLFRNFAVDPARHAIAVSQKSATLSAEQFREQVIDVVASAEQAYWQLVFATKNLDVELEGLRLAQAQAASNARRANAGTLAPIDATEALTQVAAAEQSVYQAQQAVSVAETQLKTLMLPNRQSPLWRVALTPTTSLEATVPSQDLDEAVAQALRTRPEIAASDLAASINESDVQFFRDETKPLVNLVANYTAAGLSGRAVSLSPIVIGGGSSELPPELVGSYGRSLSNLLNQRFPTTQVRVDVAVPIGNRTAKANLASAMVQGRQIQLQREQVEQSITADVRNAMQAVESTRARVRSAGDGQRWAEDLYASEQRKFQAGTTTVFLLFQRQTAMINARTQLARAQADLSIALSQYAAATGTTLQARNINVQP